MTVGVFPSDDTFEEFSTHYGQRLASYLRHRPWVTATDTQTDYAIGNGVGDLHNGYSSSSQLAAFKCQGNTGTNDNMGAVLWRQEFLTNVTVAVSIKAMSTGGGSITLDHFRWAGVCGRVSVGSYTDTTGQQSIRDTTGYWFILAHKAGVTGVDSKFLMLRVNSGTITVLDTKNATAEATACISGFHKIALAITTTGGNAVLTGYFDDVVITSVTDSSGSKITTAGRCGFGMVRERTVSGVKIATVASLFSIVNDSTGSKVLEDDFTRENIGCNPSVTDDNGTTGKVLMSMWSLDIHGPAGWVSGSSQFRDAGLDRIRAEDGDYSFSQIPASNAYTQNRLITFRLTE